MKFSLREWVWCWFQMYQSNAGKNSRCCDICRHADQKGVRRKRQASLARWQRANPRFGNGVVRSDRFTLMFSWQKARTCLLQGLNGARQPGCGGDHILSFPPQSVSPKRSQVSWNTHTCTHLNSTVNAHITWRDNNTLINVTDASSNQNNTVGSDLGQN